MYVFIVFIKYIRRIENEKILAFVLFITSLFSLVGCKVEPAEPNTFYEIDEAYKMKLLSKADLRKIKYYFDNHEKIFPEEPLNKEVENTIKEDYLRDLKLKTSPLFQDLTVDDIIIEGYFENYNNSCVLLLTYVDAIYTLPFITREVAGYTFDNRYYMCISVWYQGDN